MSAHNVKNALLTELEQTNPWGLKPDSGTGLCTWGPFNILIKTLLLVLVQALHQTFLPTFDKYKLNCPVIIHASLVNSMTTFAELVTHVFKNTCKVSLYDPQIDTNK